MSNNKEKKDNPTLLGINIPSLNFNEIAERKCNEEIDLLISTNKKKDCQLIIEQEGSYIYLTKQKLQDLICSLIGVYTEMSGIKPFGTFFKDIKQMKKEEVKEEIERFLQAIQCQPNLIRLINAFDSCKYRLLKINEIYDIKLDMLKIKRNL